MKNILKTGLKFTLFLLWIELCTYLLLRIIGINPLNYQTGGTWGRSLSGFFVLKNSSNFSFTASNGLDNFKPLNESTDDYGFLCDHKITVRKPPGVIRIFIVGGSAAWGSIENRDITQDSTYPSGIYSYNSSIAGLLKAELQHRYPDKAFEVINAGTVMHTFVQEWLKYLSLIHRFKPDIVINLTGANECSNLYKGYIFDQAELHMNEFIDAEYLRPRHQAFPFTFFLANYMNDKRQNNVMKRDIPDTNPDMMDTTSNNYKSVLRPLFEQNCDELFWCYASYLNQLKNDSVHSIFCMQPMLSCRVHQKPLSIFETKIRTNIERQEAAAPLFAQFLDTRVAAEIDSLCGISRSYFIDFNMKIEKLPAEQDFYVDYCHLTPFGNKFLSGVMADAVSAALRGR